MKSRTARLVGAGVTLAIGSIMLAASSVGAHHSLSTEFDTSKQATIVGTISKMVWSNPHAWLHVEVKDTKGQVQPWAVEFGSPNGLYRRGWRRDDLPAGATVTVTGYLARDGSKTISAGDVKLSDGRTLFAGSPQTPGAPR